ncbi:MAG: hypothetical protein ED555_11930 [Allomuricauda sp.]|nr:MAG: hypothetical protein ED555_11930 [Allomuricauda sp.]
MKKNILYALMGLSLMVVTSETIQAQQKEIQLTAEEIEIFKEAEEKETEEEAYDESEYDIVIMDIGFNTWLTRIAQPKGYYTQSFMERRNYLYVLEWNRRVLEPRVFNPRLYELQINYDPEIDYGYDVNYKLYNYFIYFQRRYDQHLGLWVPRI